jgi:hypothetical protein
MSTFEKSQRNYIYKKALEIFRERDFKTCHLCLCINEAHAEIYKFHIHPDELGKTFPEFYNYKPAEIKSFYTSWFPMNEDSKKMRESILISIIKETENDPI